MLQVSEFEHMLYEDGVRVIKFWFSISKDEQKRRFDSRMKNPLKQWKFSPVDMKGQELWDKYTHYKEQMFAKTHTAFSPWLIVKTQRQTDRQDLRPCAMCSHNLNTPERESPKQFCFPIPTLFFAITATSNKLTCNHEH